MARVWALCLGCLDGVGQQYCSNVQLNCTTSTIGTEIMYLLDAAYCTTVLAEPARLPNADRGVRRAEDHHRPHVLEGRVFT